MRRLHLPPLLFWTLLCALFFAPLLAGVARLPDGDFSGQYHAFALFQAREMAAGRLPLWSPGSYGGFPFAADTQAAVFYPPRWLTVLLSLPWSLPYYALQLEGIVHIWLAGVFTYFLAYTITRERLAGLLAAIAFGLSGYLTAYPLLQLTILETIAWLPLLLLLLRRGIQNRRPLPWLLAAGVVLGISALAGHPQIFLHVSYTAAAYYFFLAWRARWRWPWLIGLGALTGIVAAGVAAVAWLPAVRYVAQTTRGEVTYEFVAQGFPLLDYLQILAPRALSFWAPQYVGIAALCLALVAWWSGRRATGEIVFWGVIALVAAWISLGDKGILFELVYHLAPGFAFFRQQERLAGVVSLSLALLAAQGLALWLRLTVADRRRLWRRLAYTMAGSLLLVGVILVMAQQIAAANWLQIWLRQWLVVAVVLGLLYEGRPATDDGRRAAWIGRWSTVAGRQEAARIRIMVLVLFLALDLYVSVGGAMDLQPESPAVVWPRPGWLDQLDADEPGRLDSSNLFHASLGEVYGVEDVRGLSPLKALFVERFEELPRPRRWQLLNVTHVLAEAPIEPALTEVASFRSSIVPGEAIAARLYRFTEALPRAWMSYQPIVVADAETAFQTLQDPGFDPAAQAVLHTPVEGLESVRAPDSEPHVHVTRQAANALAIEVTTAAPGLLVISEWAYRGWQATVNGQPMPLLPADYALQALLLPAGTHTVELRFTLPGLAAGALVTVATLFLAKLLAWRWSPQVTLGAVLKAKKERAWPEPAGAPTPKLLSPSIFRWLATFVLLLAFALRLFTSASQELRPEEAFSALFADRPAAEIVPDLIEAGEMPAPFHYLTLHGWIQLVGKSELALRYLSISLSLLLLPLMYQVGRRLRDKSLGLLLLMLMAVSQSLIGVGQDVRHAYAWTPVLAEAGTPELAQHLVNFGHELTVGGTFDRSVGRWLFLGALIVALHGAYRLRRRKPGWAALLVGWLASAALFTYLFRFQRAPFNDYYIMLAAPAWWALLATSLLSLWRSRQWWQRFVGVAAVAALLTGSVLSLANYYFSARDNRTLGYRPIAAQLIQLQEPNDVFLANAPDPALTYYLEEVELPRALWPSRGDEPAAETEAGLAQLAAQYDRIWFVPAAGSDWDGDGVVARWLDNQALREWDLDYEKLSLHAYRPLHAVDQVLLPLDLPLGSSIQLEGAFVTIDGIPVNLNEPVPVGMGSTVNVTLVWQARTAVAESYTVFVHMLDGNGILIAQHDGIPVAGSRPTFTWEAGERLIDVHTLAIPAGVTFGHGQIVAGMYHTETVERLLFAGGRDAIPFASIRLVP